jgi:hypothetical protein
MSDAHSGGKIGEDESYDRYINGIVEPKLQEKKRESASRFSAHLHQYILITSYSGCSAPDLLSGRKRYCEWLCQPGGFDEHAGEGCDNRHGAKYHDNCRNTNCGRDDARAGECHCQDCHANHD